MSFDYHRSPSPKPVRAPASAPASSGVDERLGFSTLRLFSAELEGLPIDQPPTSPWWLSAQPGYRLSPLPATVNTLRGEVVSSPASRRDDEPHRLPAVGSRLDAPISCDGGDDGESTSAGRI